MKRSEVLSLMDYEVNYHQGIRPSGEINGTSSVIYDGDEIKPDEVLHFSLQHEVNLDQRREDNQIMKLTDEYKESSWAKAKHVIFQASLSKMDKYQTQSFYEWVSSYFPFRRFIIPMTSTDKWNRNIDSWTPIFSVLFLLLVTDSLDIYDPIQIFVLSTMASVSILIRFNTYQSEPPPSPISELLILHSFVMSIVWVWMLANIIVDIIHSVDVVTQSTLNYNYFGLLLAATFVAFGNSKSLFL